MMLKNLVLSTFTVLAIIVLVQGNVSAQILGSSDARCANASGVTTSQAQSRYAWALYCSKQTIPGAGVTPIPSYKFLTEESIKDYDASVQSLKDRLFPTYFNFTSPSTVWDIPNSVSGTPAGKEECYIFPTSALNVGLCTAGCYTPDTTIQFADGEVGVKEAAEAGRLDLVTLTPESTIDALQTITNTVERYTISIRDEVETIYSFQMKSGGTLRVTSEHPLVTSDGIMRQAKSLKVGTELVRANGMPDPIISIGVSRVHGKVYNVRPVSMDYSSNIVIAAGYLNGSSRYQNQFLDRINAVILRRSLSKLAK